MERLVESLWGESARRVERLAEFKAGQSASMASNNSSRVHSIFSRKRIIEVKLKIRDKRSRSITVFPNIPRGNTVIGTVAKIMGSNCSVELFTDENLAVETPNASIVDATVPPRPPFAYPIVLGRLLRPIVSSDRVLGPVPAHWSCRRAAGAQNVEHPRGDYGAAGTCHACPEGGSYPSIQDVSATGIGAVTEAESNPPTGSSSTNLSPNQHHKIRSVPLSVDSKSIVNAPFAPPAPGHSPSVASSSPDHHPAHNNSADIRLQPPAYDPRARLHTHTLKQRTGAGTCRGIKEYRRLRRPSAPTLHVGEAPNLHGATITQHATTWQISVFNPQHTHTHSNNAPERGRAKALKLVHPHWRAASLRKTAFDPPHSIRSERTAERPGGYGASYGAFDPGDRAGFFETVKQVTAAEVPAPKASPFRFVFSAEAADHNTMVLERYDFDLAKVIDDSPESHNSGRAGFFETVKQVTAAEVPAPKASPFRFEFSAEAAEHNTTVLERYDFDLAKGYDGRHAHPSRRRRHPTFT
ncbi:hypothetical protein THAOC_19070, partial [Thalassiosira oceanica]